MTSSVAQNADVIFYSLYEKSITIITTNTTEKLFQLFLL